MIDKVALLADLKPQVKTLERDLLQRAGQVPDFAESLNAEWRRARDAGRTAATYETWLDGEVTQSAVAWVLGTVFLRFCEDNALIDLPYLAGPEERLAVATERQQDYFERNPQGTDRDWIAAGFEDMSAASQVAAGLFERDHNPMWRITPSHPAAKALLAFWRTPNSTGNVAHDFTDPGWDTRFLGDLYQDLSDRAKKTYALLQTPDFVEDFILDLTIKPAIDEFGLEPDPPRARPDLPPALRVIDPACGSGHFLLGAFQKLLDAWEDHAATTDPWDRITRILNGLHGVDKNPFAVSIARFRLLIAVMKAGGVKTLASAHDFPLNIAVADSLLHGRGGPGEQGELFNDGFFTYRTEDVARFIKAADVLGMNSYHVVVGNPPYITVKDKKENDNYRKAYSNVCSGKYALSVPFAARFFRLAKVAAEDRRGAGYVGQITSNSFMKREFGKKLIEEFLSQKIDLTHVIDTSGAYVPGHGTPTVILVGRNMIATTRPIRAVLGIQGEPTQPDDPSKGYVWRSIVDNFEKPGENEWVSVVDLPRKHLSNYPWSLSGGGAGELLDRLDRRDKLDRHIDTAIGFYDITGDDEVFIFERQMPLWTQAEVASRDFATGDGVRDWSVTSRYVLWPYEGRTPVDSLKETSVFWPYRSSMVAGLTFGKTREQRGMSWHEHTMLNWARSEARYLIAFACVATHAHFVLDRAKLVFNRHAPVIKMPEGASEDDHLKLIGILNSSAACFWLKQVSHGKGNGGVNEGYRGDSWEEFYEFTGTKLEDFPLPAELPLEYGRMLDGLARRVTQLEPSTVCAEAIPTRVLLDKAKTEHERVRARMIAVQEELDWEVYRIYGLLTEDEAKELRAGSDAIAGLALGERAFEIVLARRVAAGEVETQWFVRHGSNPITEIPAHWPVEYQQVVRRRIDVIGRRRDLALIERPECKRRWQTESWEKKEAAALRAWLLDRCERRELWFAASDTGRDEPRPLTVNRLADLLRADTDFVSVARLYAGADADLAEVIAEIIKAEHVPYLAAMRYTDTGLRKRAQWERTWELQREEDATGTRLDIAVPPKYAQVDFRRTSFWGNRGKLDVPKERFISYERASPDGDNSLLLGWAGWDHREQAHALMTVIEDRTARDGWGCERLIPLIAGLAEVLPWVRQWHGGVDPGFGMSPADAYAAYLDDQQRRCGVSSADLTGWRPPSGGRGGAAR